MGYSTPKKPLNLVEFLSQKGKPRSVRKPAWNMRPGTAKPPCDKPEEAAVAAKSDAV
ncbi:hypothetical protein [Phaeovulum sp. NW3]|uniref:hypothetical protein n=1 Tax=Phaeovulum sp. NW3 TaxID=2934933 RepID=UPI002020784A|nr:hypothetical protein [Phaeovulum sp. NW3]MCL7466765.1 hypothetical protein [Phaeovulum sp. NW3]